MDPVPSPLQPRIHRPRGATTPDAKAETDRRVPARSAARPEPDRLLVHLVRRLRRPSHALWSQDVHGALPPRGRYRRVKLGVYPELSLADARRRARQVVGEVASDRDPAQARRDARLAPTFEHLANLYVEKHARVKKRSWKEDRRVINKELFPAWRAMRAAEIRRRDIRTPIEKIAERPAPSMANRTQALIHKMFNSAIAHEIVEFNPCAQLEHPAKERARDRILTDAEIRQFWSVLDGEPPHLAAAFRLRLITAQRGGEVHGMRWEDIDLDGRWWTIPGSVAKNGLAHRVPLSDRQDGGVSVCAVGCRLPPATRDGGARRSHGWG